MADNGFKINKSANFNPQAGAPANPVDGDFYYDSTAQSFAYYHNGSWANLDSVGVVTAALWLTGAQFTPAIVRNSVVKVVGGVSPIHLAGIASSFSAKQITIYNAGSDIIVVEPEDAMEPTVNNRIMTPTGGSMNLIAGEVAVFTYDIVQNRWLLVSISSQAGAQVIATISNPGLVTLHQPSLLPLDGVVLSDGDLNTANGVVGLDGNRAVTIAAPLASVTALTVTAASNAAALVLNGSTGSASLQRLQIGGGSGNFLEWLDGSLVSLGTISNDGSIELESAVRLVQNVGGGVTTSFFIDDDEVQLGRRQLKFSNDDGFSNTYNNFMEYTYLGGPSRRGIRIVNETNTGTGEVWFETNGGVNPANTRTDLILKPAAGADQYISNTNGNLYLNMLNTGTVFAGFANTGTWDFSSAFTTVWQITGSGSSPAGALQAVGANRLIRNLADPLSQRDAANKGWVSTERQNYIINGAFDFWQRLRSGFSSFTLNSSSLPGGTGASIYYTADRWYYFTTGLGSGNEIVVSRQTAPTSEADLGATYTLRMQRTSGNTSTAQHGMIQEFDRRWVKQMRGKTFTVRLRARAGTTYSGTFTVAIVHDDGGDENQLSGKPPYYTGGVAIASTSPVLTLGGAFTDIYLNVPTLPTNITAASIQIYQIPSGNAAGSDWFEISQVQVTEGTGVTGQQFRLAGDSLEGEEKLCQQYFERSYGPGQGVGLVNNFYDSHLTVAPNDVGGLYYFSGPRYRATKWIGTGGGAVLPTITLYDFSGASARVTVDGVDNNAYVVDMSGTNNFICHLSSATTPGNLIQFHWTAESEIR